MFTERQCQILAFLSGVDSWVQGSVLAEMIGASSRTLQNEIKNINSVISQNDLPGEFGIISNNRLGYRLKDDQSTLQYILNETMRKKVSKDKYIHSKHILMLLLFEKDYISIGTIADRLYYSKSSVSADIPQVKRIVARNAGAVLKISSNKGIRLDAPENMKRILCMKTITGICDYFQTTEVMKMIFEDQKKMESIIGRIFTEFDFIVSGEAYSDFALYLLISIARTRMGFKEDMPCDSLLLSDITNEIVNQVKAEFDYSFSEAEKQSMEGRIQELNIVCKNPVANADIGRNIEEFIHQVAAETGYKIKISKDLKAAMTDHMDRMIRRIRSGRTNVGNYTKDLLSRYPMELHLLKTCLCQSLNIDIPDAELGYLILYLATAVESERKKIDALLVSDNSASSIYNLENKLKKSNGEQIGTITAIPMYLFENKSSEYKGETQLLLTTERELALVDKRFFYLDLFINNHQLSQLKKKTEEMLADWKVGRMKLQIEKYLKPGYKIKVSGECKSIKEMLENLDIPFEEKVTSIESIGSKVLYIISHDRSGKNLFHKIELEQPFQFGGKQITTIWLIHFGGDGDIVEFFDFVSAQITSMP